MFYDVRSDKIIKWSILLRHGCNGFTIAKNIINLNDFIDEWPGYKFAAYPPRSSSVER